ncbi:MAG: DUF1579 domain-containing protein [Planctomycetota bacterium]
MKLRILLLSLIAAGLAGWTSSAARQAPARPTEHHDLLKRMVGTWDATVSMMGAESKGTFTVEHAMNGLWCATRFEGDFFGSPYEGRGFEGYDPAKKKYVSVWVDSMNAKVQSYEGTYDAESEVLTLHGQGTNPMTGEPMDEVHRIVFDGDDAMGFEMVMKPEGGEEIPMMSISYTRRK